MGTQQRIGRPRNRSIGLVATSLGFGVVQLDVSVVNVATTSIRADLGGDLAGLQWVVNAYTLTFAALILSAGALGDRIGARRVFVCGFALFTAASAACGSAPTVGWLVAARAVQGIGAAALVSCSLALLSHSYPDPRERRHAIGLWAAGASTALAGGPLVGGALIAGFGWRSIFLINLPLGLLAIVLVLRHTSETSRSGERALDLPGQMAALGALGALTSAVIEGGRLGFGHPLVITGLALAAPAAALFVGIERRADAPMLSPELIGRRRVAVVVAIGLLVNTAFYGLAFLLALFFQQTWGLTPLLAGLAFGPTTGAVLLANLVASRLQSAWGDARVLVGGTVSLLAGVAGLFGAGPDTSYGRIVVPLVVLGAGLGVVVPVMTATLLGAVEARRSGIASATLNTARQTGSAIGVAVFGTLATGGVVTGLSAAVVTALVLVGAAGALAVSAHRSPAER